MLYSFLISLIDQFSALNVFRYLTFRTGLSVMSSMIIVFLIGGPFIKFIESHKITGPIRDDGPIDHIVKKVGTPTMGGLLILIGILFGTLLWADLNNPYIWVLLMVATSFGLLGALDDYLKIKFENSTGIKAKTKFFWQLIIFRGSTGQKSSDNGERVVLMGFSQGAVAALGIQAQRPDLVAGVIAISGYFPLKTEDLATNLNGAKIFLGHGTSDTVVPVTLGRQSLKILEELSAAVTYREYPIGHQISMDELEDIRVWLDETLSRPK